MNQTQVLTRPDWRIELQRAYKSPAELLTAVGLDPTEFSNDSDARRLFPMLVPRPFAQLMEYGNRNDPLLLQVLPAAAEFNSPPGFTDDPLAERTPQVTAVAAAGLLHKYRSRALIILKGGCAVNCRYCFRRHFPYDKVHFNQQQLRETVHYLNQHQDVNEVILSGGDPLMASDRQLATIISALAEVNSLKRLRIHSRLPVIIPDRITASLTQALTSTRLKPALVIHANHGNEISAALGAALQPLRQAGVHLFNQSVLLKGINDNVADLVQLSERLYDIDVLPYYLHQLDKVLGAAHFDVDLAHAKTLWRQLNASLPGFLVPKLVQDIAGQPSKTPIMPDGLARI
ncbi:EF-P beta-lysylation protein EpmB [Idiomarina seosinensis]|uniref:EF-P beta-lysylation protein EpmB n=1 Tax=Idiomarina seosinensis TaxID=281739 RepID=UPI00384D6E5D